MFRALRPVGESISIRGSAKSIDSIWPLDDGWRRQFYASGTAALAAACCVAVTRRAVSKPEIIIPAYTCPSVISAVEYSGATPILVDFDPDRALINLDCLRALLSSSTVAVMAVNLLGIPERIVGLRIAIGTHDALLIYDHCQGLAIPSIDASLADMSIFSFGRGKPCSALGGGALLVAPRSIDDAPLPRLDESDKKAPILAILLYNFLIQPRMYWLPKALPFLRLGETRYGPLSTINGLDESGITQIVSNIAASLRRVPIIESEIRKRVNAFPQVIDLPSVDVNSNARLLRYPILMPSNGKRDAALHALDQAGLGATWLYKDPLNELPDLAGRFPKSLSVPHARDFASRLLTLPCHSSVTRSDLDKIFRIVEAVLRE